jgi:hypothetical protein
LPYRHCIGDASFADGLTGWRGRRPGSQQRDKWVVRATASIPRPAGPDPRQLGAFTSRRALSERRWQQRAPATLATTGSLWHRRRSLGRLPSRKFQLEERLLGGPRLARSRPRRRNADRDARRAPQLRPDPAPTGSASRCAAHDVSRPPAHRGDAHGAARQ